MFKKQIPVKNILYIVCTVGLVLAAAISVPLLVVSIVHMKEGSDSKHVTASRSNPFMENLNAFDQIFSQKRSSPLISQLDSILNTAEQHALSVDAHVSVLKRRRILATEMPEYRPQYQNAALRSQEQFPYSEIISILAGESLLQNNQLNENNRKVLSNCIKNITVRNPVILLGFYLMEGTARNFSSAKQIPQAAEIFISAVDHIDKTEQPGLITSAAILQIIAGNQNGAINLINKYRPVLLEQPDSAWFMAETLYDFADPAVVASVLGIEDYPYVNSQSIIRLSDALYRTNNTNDARFFWNLLTVPEDTQKAEQAALPQAILEKALYNLASTSQTETEKEQYLDKLLVLSPYHISGIIMYSRLLNHTNAISLLNQTLEEKKDAFIELELIKRNRGYEETGKTTADIWLLLGRYPKNPDLYQWASYYFEEMRLFDETEQLEKNAGYNNIPEKIFILPKALNAIRAGKLNEAEQILTDFSSENAWEIFANLGLIKESHLSFTEAIEYYEKASSFCEDKKDQALIQCNIARCFNATGNPTEAIRILNYARDLDPESLRIRLELRKLQDQ